MRVPARTLGAAACGAALALLLGSGCSTSSGGPPPPPPADGLAGAQGWIAQREYEASAGRDGLQAPNRAQGLRSYFTPTGVRVHDRTAPGSPELLALSLRAFGREGALDPVGPGEVASEGARVEIRREGVTEWYLNSPRGLEHGFTIERPPAGEGELVLEIAVYGARAELGEQGVVFRSASGRRLRYGELQARDAAVQRLAAHFGVAADGNLRIVLVDDSALYPVTIDPMLAAMAGAQLESDQAGAQLGSSVASAGDVNGDGYDDAIVGAPYYDSGELDEGAAFVFLGSASGMADGSPGTAAAKLESDQADAQLGQSVASAGDVNGDGYGDLVVGAGYYDAGEVDEGAAFVFLGSASGIADGNPSTAAARLESDQAGAYLGTSVASAGDVNGDGYDDVIVGASSFDAGELDEGAAFVFLGSAGGIANGRPATAAAQLESDRAGSGLGVSVASAGDVNGDGYDDVIAGAPTYADGPSLEGMVLVFLGSASGIAGRNPATAAAQIESDTYLAVLGVSVASAGDVNGDGYDDVIVGAPYYNFAHGGEPGGAAFVFLGSATGITGESLATAAGQIEYPQLGEHWPGFGGSVASAGDLNGDGYADVIVGFLDGDSALVYLGSAAGIGGLTTAAVIIELQIYYLPRVGFGSSVASAGDVNGDGYDDLIVGAPLFDSDEMDEGAAFAFLGSPSWVAGGHPGAATQLASDQAGASYGMSASSAGDVNGDGYGDVIAGFPYYDAGQANEGAAFVFLGSAAGISDGSPATAASQLESDQLSAHLGSNVASAGDVNGDGFGDVIVGAPQYGAGQANEGAAFVFLGSAAGISDGSPATAASQLESDQLSAYLGSNVASAGDVNGDGFGDVIVGAPLYDAGQMDEGAVFIFLGSSSGIAGGSPATAAAQIESDQAQAQLGSSAALAGDANGDGYDDVIVGASLYDAGQDDEGAAFVFLGSATGIADASPATAAAQLESDQTDAGLGASVASAGDVNGDGYDDVIVGAPSYDAGQRNEGAAFVFLGSASGTADGSPATAAAQIESDRFDTAFSATVAFAGDVNGDGYDDVIVRAPRYPIDEFTVGAVFLFSGSATGIGGGSADSAEARIESNQMLIAFFGGNAAWPSSIAGAGDVDGDGYDDVILGDATFDTGAGPSEGAAFVYLANGDWLDTDADGAPNGHDNCINAANPGQADGDGDGCGNACDADYDNNGVTGGSDWNALRGCLGSAAVGACAALDSDANGLIGASDFNTLRTGFGKPAGPSLDPLRVGAPACP